MRIQHSAAANNSVPGYEAENVSMKQLIMMKLPHMDLNTLSVKSVSDLDGLLKISRTLEQMKPRSKH